MQRGGDLPCLGIRSPMPNHRLEGLRQGPCIPVRPGGSLGGSGTRVSTGRGPEAGGEGTVVP